MTDETHIHDVVQIGYGPVGQTMAALLGRQGRDVAVFERHAGLYALPRAGHIDHEIMRVFQSIGCAEAVLDDAYRCSTYGWRNQHGETLLDIDWSRDGLSGWASDYLIYQPYLEDALDRAVRAQPSVSVFHGWDATGVVQHEGFVEVTLARGALDGAGVYRHTGEERVVRARYLVGADGANSFVRGATGLSLTDLGFREQWLVCDFRQRRPLSFAFDNGQICDPARPLCLFQLGRTHRRFEFMVLPGEDAAAMARPETAWRLVSSWIGPEDAELIRSTVYTFRSANADQWRAGRALLIGDAAHLMPPFLGQGMCSGVRDAAGLAWKLNLVLAGQAPETLLDSHGEERRPHVGNIIEQAVALGKVSCTIDPEEAAARDQAFLTGAVPPPPPFPWIERGILQGEPGGAAAALVGRLGPQGRVRAGEREGLADDVVGPGWCLILREGVNSPSLGGRARATLRGLAAQVLAFGSEGLIDVDGAYRAYFDAAGVDAILVRPDFYVFGATESVDGVDAMLCEAVDRIGLELACEPS